MSKYNTLLEYITRVQTKWEKLYMYKYCTTHISSASNSVHCVIEVQYNKADS